MDDGNAWRIGYAAFALNRLNIAAEAVNSPAMIRTSIPSRASRRATVIAFAGAFAGLAAFSIGETAYAETYQVGPGKPYRELTDVAQRLQPGDVVEVEGNATYSGNVSLSKNGSANSKITIRGILRNGKRPTILGGTNTIAVHGSHYVLEGLDVTGGSFRCIYHHANDLTVHDTVVHDCSGHGILGADTESGSLTLDRVEVYRCGEGTRKHQVYVATDEKAYPDAVFRMQHSYVHDGNGGNNVKSRAGRNEIYYNWIEGATYHELELIGPEEFAEQLLREDSDVVGNVLRKTKQGSFVARFGGDGAGQTNGRYRFVNNTVIVNNGTKGVFRLFDGLESVEVHNNAFSNTGGGAVALIRDAEAKWARGRAILVGSNNWVPAGTKTPSGWSDTRSGSDPGFANVNALDFSPGEGSPLQDAGDDSPSSPADVPFQHPLMVPAFAPPSRQIATPIQRGQSGVIDIGALEGGMKAKFGAFSSDEEPNEYEDTAQSEQGLSMQDALIEAYATGEEISCSMGRGQASHAGVAASLVGLAGLLVARRKKR